MSPTRCRISILVEGPYGRKVWRFNTQPPIGREINGQLIPRSHHSQNASHDPSYHLLNDETALEDEGEPDNMT